VRHVAQGEAIEVIGPNVASNPLGSCLRRGGDDEGTSPTRTGPSYSWALKLLIEAREHPFDLLARHAAGDWGELCAFDHRQNELALRYGYRVLSSYDVPAGRVWIITEADRSVTTILLPEDY